MNIDEGYNMYLKGLRKNVNRVSEIMESEYDIDVEYNMYLKSLRENSKGKFESIKRKYYNAEDDIDSDRNKRIKANKDGIDQDCKVYLRIKRGKTNEIPHAIELNKEDQINNTEKFPLGSNGQGQDSFLDATEMGKNGLHFVIKKEDDGECTYDREILVMNDALDYGKGNLSPFLSSKVYHAHLESEGQCSKNTDGKARSKFRDEVLALYQKSYNQGELHELLEQVKLQKPITGWINLFGKSVSFPTDGSNKSYLDHYPDLKTELDRVFLDQWKMLNTLRGFFYWLKNLSGEGAFKPWLDPFCQAITPGVL